MNGKTGISFFAALLAVCSLLIACHRDAGAASDGNVASLRYIMYNGKASTALRSDVMARVTDSFGGSSATVAPAATSVSNPAGTALGATMAFNPAVSPNALIQTSSGFFYCYNSTTGDVCQLVAVYYTSNDCTGQAYLTVGDDPSNSIPSIGARKGNGWGFTLADGTADMLNPATAQTATETLSSVFLNGNCNPISLPSITVFIAQANDPAVSLMAGPNVGGNGTMNAPGT